MTRAAPAIGESGYQRLDADAYRTPAWVTEALLANVEVRGPIWEPAAGEGDMAVVLARNLKVFTSDLRQTGTDWDGLDFDTSLEWSEAARKRGHPLHGVQSVVTNPPYALADRFIERALALTSERNGMLALLLPHEFDCAAGRHEIFAGHPAFACKMTLTKRIRWLGLPPPEPGKKKSTPRKHHAWYVWDFRKHDLAPATVRWA